MKGAENRAGDARHVPHPRPGQLFEVSTDELFDYNRLEREERVLDFATRAAKLRDEKPAEAEPNLGWGKRELSWLDEDIWPLLEK